LLFLLITNNHQGWQQKLSQLQVATFPWDPKVEPQPIANPPTVPSNAGTAYNNNPPPAQNNGLSLPLPSNPNQPRIKPEPEEGNAIQQQPLINIPGATAAQQRAAQHLQNNYGHRAAASINAIQGTAGANAMQQPQGQPQHQQGAPNPQLQQQQQQQQQQMHAMHQQQQHQMQMQQQRAQGAPAPNQQVPGQPHPNPQLAQQQYRAMLARDAAARTAQLQNQQPSIKQAQTDGAGDEYEATSVVKQFDAEGNEIAMGRVEIDGLIRAKIVAMGQTMEGGGLMLPLKQASTRATRERKVERRNPAGLGGGDAADDDEKDEDAINSDLDDPEDALNDDEDEDDNMGHIMLCMYDKVQRVKNKWYVNSCGVCVCDLKNSPAVLGRRMLSNIACQSFEYCTNTCDVGSAS
jgi:transcription initiation factor TFIIA large subunit